MVRDFASQEKYNTPWPDVVRGFFLRYPNPLATHVLSVDVLDRQIVTADTPSYIYPPDTHEQQGQSTHPAARKPIIPWRQFTESSSSSTDAIPSSTPPLVLRTTRLILKQGTLPRWAPKGVIKNTLSWVLEESEIGLDYEAGQTFDAASSSSSSSSPDHTRGRVMRIWTRNLDHTTAMAVTEGIEMAECLKEAAQVQQPNPPLILPWTRMTTTARVESNVGFALLRNRIEKFGLNRVRAHKDNSKEGLFWAITRLPHPLSAAPSHDPKSTSSEPDEHPPQRSAPRRLLAALRPPFLDGYPVGPVQRLRSWAQGWWERWSLRWRGTVLGPQARLQEKERREAGGEQK